MAEHRFFPEGTVPEWTTAAWYADREVAPHVDEAMHRPRLDLAADMVRAILSTYGQMSAPPVLVDLGAGDGGFLTLIRDERVAARGIDITPSNVEGAVARGVDVRLGDFLDPDYDLGPVDIVVCTEVIEHLLDPHAFVCSLAVRGVEFVVASSPWNETPDAHYGFHLWGWDVPGYRALFEQAGYDVTRQETTGMFQVLTAAMP